MTFIPLRDIEAQLRTMEGEQIQKYAKELKPNGVYLEIGTKFGGSAYWVRSNADDSCEVWSVDPKANLYMFQGKENELGIGWIKGYSTEVAKDWNKPIDILFIDGDHGEVELTAPWDDFVAWEKFVPSGGVIMFHDYHFDFPEVVKACDKVLKERNDFELLEIPPEIANRQDTSLFVIRKK